MSGDSHPDKVPGFVEFHPLKGPEAEDHTIYASHTVWENRAVFEAWTKSEAFRAALGTASKQIELPLRAGLHTGEIEIRDRDIGGISPVLIDYVICHELAHAFHPDHGAKWRNLLDAVMPDWEVRKSHLEAALR
jgi:heme-degrading monooxygenase HmoA